MKLLYFYKVKKRINQLLQKWIITNLFIITFHINYAQSSYVKHYRPLSDSLYMRYGIPASVILGIAIIESSRGTSRNCRLLNNHFGIVGKNNLWKTKRIKTRYKQYADSRSSFIDFCKMISKKKYYTRLKGNRNYLPWLNAISKYAYSEAPALWKQRITAAIKKNKLA